NVAQDDALPNNDSLTAVSGLSVGHWTDGESPTGCTVVICPPEGAVASGDVRGGAPGTRNTDLLRPGHLVERVHAILLTGGSEFGHEAAAGVVRGLSKAPSRRCARRRRSRRFWRRPRIRRSASWQRMPC